MTDPQIIDISLTLALALFLFLANRQQRKLKTDLDKIHVRLRNLEDALRVKDVTAE